MAARRMDLLPIQIPEKQTQTGSVVTDNNLLNGVNPPAVSRSAGAGRSIRDIRAAMPQSPTAATKSSPSSQAASKKRQSLFGGLFQKEPSMAALNQVTAQMASQQGGVVSAKTLPLVSSQKMPGHVPKVNSKWDGIPDAVRRNDKEAKRAVRHSLLVSKNDLQTTHAANRLGRISERRHSHAESWDSRSSGSRLEFVDDPVRPDSIYSSSSGGSSLPPKPNSVRSQSFRSPSGTSLPEITAYFPNDIPTAQTVPRSLYSSSNSEIPTLSSGRSSEQHRSYTSSTGVKWSAEQTTYALSSPMEQSPSTSNTSPASPILNMAKYGKRQPIDAFLAGEAQLFELPGDMAGKASFLPQDKVLSQHVDTPPIARVEQDIQKRPDSSRARLGLRASMVVRTDAAPWEAQEIESPSGARSPVSSKTKLRLRSKR